MLERFNLRLHALFRKDEVEQQLDEEFVYHIEKEGHLREMGPTSTNIWTGAHEKYVYRGHFFHEKHV